MAKKTNKHWWSVEAMNIAEEMIDKYPEFAELQECRIDYIHCEKTPKSNGMQIMGQVIPIRGRRAYRAAKPEYDPRNVGWVAGVNYWEVLFPIDVWNDLDDNGKSGLVHHELSHCGYDPEEKSIHTYPHDITEFFKTTRRFGNYHPANKPFVDAYIEWEGKQSKMVFDGNKEESEKSSLTLSSAAPPMNGTPYLRKPDMSVTFTHDDLQTVKAAANELRNRHGR
jgi:hypothetical protein